MHKEGESQSRIKEFIWGISHPNKFIETKRRQFLVYFEHESPPPGSTFEEFPLLSPRQASTLMDKEVKKEQEFIMERKIFHRIVGLFDRAVFNLSAEALEKLSDIAFAGNQCAQEYSDIVDKLKLKNLLDYKEEKNPEFGHCRQCGSLGIEKNHKFGEEISQFVCSNGECTQPIMPSVLVGDDEIQQFEKATTSWSERKHPLQKKLEDMGYNWNLIHYRREDNII